MIQALSPYQRELEAVAVESAFNWYWLADALMAAGFEVRLVNPAKVVQYQGLNYQLLQGVYGIGPVLAQTILPETGPVGRFGSVGQYASYCRCVDSRRESNGRKKGGNNRKNGNRYLARAHVEAANLAVRHHDKARRFYQRKAAKTHRVAALKALAHKPARACYYILLRGAPFDENKVFVQGLTHPVNPR